MKSFFLLLLIGASFSAFSQNDLLIRYPAINSDGSLISFSYQGDIWTVPAAGGKATRLTVHEAYEGNPVFSPDGKSIAFSGARYGNNDIFVIPAEGGFPKRLTYHSGNDIISSWNSSGNILFSASREFQQIERPSEIYSIAAKGGTESRLLDAVGYDPIQSPDGRFIAITRGDINPIHREDYRGASNRDLWVFDTKTKTYAKVTGYEANDMLPRWSDSRTLYFLSTNNGRNNLYKLKIDDAGKASGAPEQITDYKDHSIRYFSISGDGKTIVLERGKEIALLKTDTKAVQKVAVHISTDMRFDPELNKSVSGDVSEYLVSPNGKLLALGIRGEVYVKEINKEKSSTNNVSDHAYRDTDVAWASDSILLFTSDREDSNFDIYRVKSTDKKELNIFKSLKHQITRITKTAQDESGLSVSPDGKKLAYVRGRGTLDDLSGEEKTDKPADKDKDKKEDKVKPVKIDFDNIHQRLVQVTSFPGDESNLIISRDGETFFYTATTSTAKGRDLYSIKWNGKDLKELTKSASNPGSISMDKEGKYLYFLKTGGSMSRLDIKGDKTESLPYTAKQHIEYTAERTQVFEEAWRTIRDGFYDPQFHGKDWNKLREKYRELCIMASTNEDFRDMFNYMLGELNSSHMGFTAPQQAETQRDATGLLGVELVPMKDGMKVTHVIPDSPADKAASKLNVNDVITAVDGKAYSDSENFYDLLNIRIDERTLLNVKGADGKSREVVIRPVNNVRQLLYEEWVSDRRKLVNKFSNGKLGYIHIQAMSQPSFEVFERELQAAGYCKEGLVIDVRYNGGGSTTDYLMAVLNYKQHAYTIPRGASENLEKDKMKFREYYPIGERLVFSAWMKPSIAICNEGSYSNAEIFSYAYKTLGIGKLVGVPTNGSVISTGGKGLMDGSFVRLPFRGWYTKATDKNQELGAAVPDIIVQNSPDWIAKGTDDQLKAAVDELLKQLPKK